MTTTLRIVAGTAVAAACVAGIMVATPAAWPHITGSGARTEITPAAGDALLVCHGDFRSLGRDTSNATGMTAAAVPATAEAGAGTTTALDTPELAGASGAASTISKPAEGDDAPLIAATETYGLSQADLRGFAGGACREPLAESWLVGGSVETGENDLVVVSNPGEVPASITLTVYGASVSASPMVVPAKTQLAVPLAAIAAGNPQPVVRVSATGAPVRASLQSSLVRILDPSGIDLQDSAGSPAQKLTFAGVRVVSAVTDITSTAVRLMATDTDTTATVTATKLGETTPAMTLTVPLTGQQPAVLNLEGIALGDYTVVAEADAPLVGAVWQSGGAGAGTDFSWMTAAPQLSADVQFSVADGPSPSLALVNQSSEASEVTFTPTDGSAPATVEVAAGSSLSVIVDIGKSYTLSMTQPVSAALRYSDGSLLAGWPLWPTKGAQASITVYP